MDKLDQMLGSYGPSPSGEPYTKNFDADHSPSGMIARTGTYSVKSAVIDDDGEIYAGTDVPWNLFRSLLTYNRMGMGFQAGQGVVIHPSLLCLSCCTPSLEFCDMILWFVFRRIRGCNN